MKYDIERIAELHGITQSNVYQRLCRLRKKVIDLINKNASWHNAQRNAEMFVHYFLSENEIRVTILVRGYKMISDSEQKIDIQVKLSYRAPISF